MERHQMRKQADYSDVITSELLPAFSMDAYSSDAATALQHRKALASSLVDRLQGVLSGKHGTGYFGRGKNETAPTSALFIQTGDDKVTSYAAWKKALDAAIVANDSEKLQTLTGTDAIPYSIRYYVGTRSPSPKYTDLLVDNFPAPPKAAIKALYAGSPIAATMMQQREAQEKLDRAQEALSTKAMLLEGTYNETVDSLRRRLGDTSPEFAKKSEILRTKLQKQLGDLYKQYEALEALRAAFTKIKAKY